MSRQLFGRFKRAVGWHPAARTNKGKTMFLTTHGSGWLRSRLVKAVYLDGVDITNDTYACNERQALCYKRNEKGNKYLLAPLDDYPRVARELRRGRVVVEWKAEA